MKLFLIITLLAAVISGCGGDDGAPGADGTPGPIRTTTAEALDITIDNVTINSAPVVEFTVKDESGIPLTGLTVGTGGNLRFNIAKLVPGSLGDPGAWQNYINNSNSQGSYERDGRLEDLDNGQFIYTFATDITNVTLPLSVSYEPSLTHRVAIQVDGYPPNNPTYDFRPDGGAIAFEREIIKTESCNSCHNQLAMHGGGRVESKYCVTCHNPGSTDPDTGNTVDFTVMIHKIHRGEDLPSVKFGPDLIDDGGTGDDGTGEYRIIGYNNSVHDYSTVVFPQEIRNCTKCHDGSDPTTPQGDNWKTQLSMEACGSCHDNIDFSRDGSQLGANDPLGHSGGIITDNSFCTTCHSSGRPAGSVEESHFLAEPVAREKFKLNIVKICGVDVDTDPGPICAPGTNPTVSFSITDPTNGDARYDITAPEIAGSNLSFLVAWDTDDYNNTDGTGDRPGRADSISIAGATEDAPVGSRIYTAPAASFIIPDGTGATGYTASGSGAIGAQGRLVGDFDDDGVYNESGTCTDPVAVPSAGNCLTDERERIFVKNEVEFFRITDATVEERRPTVENNKCNQCHDQVSFHGGSRSGEYGVCILCHNPNNTDIAARNDPGAVLPALDGKTEEAIDFKRMIHGIHAGAQSNYDSSSGHGFRENGLVLFGHNGREHDYSHVRFPGILNDCETCHEPGAYFLDEEWASPTENDILSTTIATDPLTTDPTWINPDDDLNISPTAAVCSACHDSSVARAHMEVPGGAVFGETQAVISGTPIIETCSVCHGPGRDADVEVVHGLN